METYRIKVHGSTAELKYSRPVARNILNGCLLEIYTVLIKLFASLLSIWMKLRWSEHRNLQALPNMLWKHYRRKMKLLKMLQVIHSKYSLRLFSLHRKFGCMRRIRKSCDLFCSCNIHYSVLIRDKIDKVDSCCCHCR